MVCHCLPRPIRVPLSERGNDETMLIHNSVNGSRQNRLGIAPNCPEDIEKFLQDRIAGGCGNRSVKLQIVLNETI